MDEGPAYPTAVPEIMIRLLAPGDEAVVLELATSAGPGDPELLSDNNGIAIGSLKGSC